MIMNRFLALLVTFLVSCSDGTSNITNQSKDPMLFIAESTSLAAADVEVEALDRVGGGKKNFVSTSTFEYPDNGVVIGQGFDMFSERGTTGRCVDVIEVPIESSEYTNDFREVKSTYSLFKKRATSIAASGSIGGFSGSASYSSEKSHKLDLEKINLLFEFGSNIAGTKAVGVPPKGTGFEQALIKTLESGISDLEESAQLSSLEMLSTRNLPVYAYQIELSEFSKKLSSNEFRRVCGDGYVSAIHRGTEIKILASYNAKTVENRRKFKATASVGGFGAKAGGSHSGVDNLSTFNSDTKFKIFQKGGIPVSPPQKFEDIKVAISDSANFIANPAGYEVEVTPYTKLGLSGDFVKLPPSNLKRLPQYYLLLSDLYAVLDEILVEELRLQSDGTRKYPSKTIQAYGGVDDIKLLREKILQDLVYIENTIGKCVVEDISCNPTEAKNNFKKLALNSASSFLTIENPEKATPKTINDTEKRLEEYLGTSSEVALAINGTITRKTNELAAATRENDVVTASSLKPEILISMENLAKILEQANYKEVIDGSSLTALFGFRDVIEQDSYPVQILAQSLVSARNIQGDENGNLGNDFFLQFYDYLTQIPLPKSMITSEKIISKKADDKKKKAERQKELENTIFLERLKPWNDYFCNEVFSDIMCLSDSSLWSYVDKLDTKTIVSEAYSTKYKDCHQFHRSVFGGFMMKKRGRWHPHPHPHDGFTYEPKGKRLIHCKYVYVSPPI